MRMNSVLVGAFDGLVATAAMTGWMALGQRLAHYDDQPPERLVRKAARRAGLPSRRERPEIKTTWILAHLGFGMACGAAYTLAVPRSSTTRGMTFALGVWATSYLGWAPALGLMPPPHHDRPARAVVTATAHLVYGAVLGRLAPHRTG